MGRRKMPPAASAEEREDQLVSLAYDLVEERLIDGSATAAETVTLLKLGTGRESLERERLKNENLLLSARVDAMESAKRVEGLIGEALHAFKRYSGNFDEGDNPDEDAIYDSY